jgi:hypothetical protein
MALLNLARMTTATTGMGTITLGSAVSGFLSFAAAGAVNGTTYSYAIKDGANSEIGTGTYTSSGTTLTRSVTKSTNSNNPINLSGSAEVFITARAEDIQALDFSNTNVASASTCDILGAATQFVTITGSTGPITSLGTGTNRIRFVKIASTPQLNHNATSLILPNNGSNITAEAGATMVVSSDSSSNATVLVYTRPNGKALYANTAYLDTAQSWTKAQRGTPVALTSSAGSIAVDMSLGNNFTHTFTENTTLADPSNLTAGQSGTIVFTQHASSPKTLAFGSKWKIAGGVAATVTATANAVDTLSYYVESASRITYSLLKNVS